MRGQVSLVSTVYAPSVQKNLEDMGSDEATAACEEDSSHFEGGGRMFRIALQAREVNVMMSP